MENKSGMTLIVKTITRLTVGLILIYGIFVVLRGHIGPGGGFAGGVIIALSLIHIILAFGKEAVLKKISQPRSIIFMSAGALLLLFMLAWGFLARRPLFLPRAGKDNFALFAAGLIPLADIAIAIMVGFGLFTIFLTLILFTEKKEGEQ